MTDIKNILIDDTHGDLEKDLFKNHPQKTSLSGWFDIVEGKQVLHLSANNIRYDSIPGVNNVTYKTFLTYNGTSGYAKKVFSALIAEDKGKFDTHNVPVLKYDPNKVIDITDIDELDDVVIDIKMYNGTVDVISYHDGILRNGEKVYKAKSVIAYPTTIKKLPNISNDTVFLDGWYSFTQILFRNLVTGGAVIEGSFYAAPGDFIFKANASGLLGWDSAQELYTIKKADGSIVAQEANENYKEILFSLNESTGTSAQANNIYLHSQVLVTEELRDAITQEIVQASCKDANGCDFADWQKLVLKRISASIMFENELYENAQIIMESARDLCSNIDHSSPCP